MARDSIDDNVIGEEKMSLKHLENITGLHDNQLEREVEEHKPRLKGKTLTYMLAFVAGTGFTLFGYDQGVMSSLLTLPRFEEVFPQVVVATGPNHATLQSFVVAVYELGCLIGALSNLFVGDKLGRRKTIILGGSIMIVGAALQTGSISYAMLVVARIITGIGNGLNTSTVPSYHAECSAAENRGAFIMIEGSLISFGIMLSYWIDIAFYWIKGSSAEWRVPISFQIILAIIMIVGVFFLPESPRWLVKEGRNSEALAVICALDVKPITHPDVQRTFTGIHEAVETESQFTNVSKSSQLSELFTHGRSQNFRRATLGVVSQCFQQISGCNLIIYYATLLFQRLNLSDTNSRFVAACNGTEFFMASTIAIFIVEKVGRRKLMIFGAGGMCISMVLLAVLGAVNTPQAQIGSAVFLFVFNSFFGIGWLGMSWLYSAEIVGLRVRAQANALSTASNWTFNFMVVMISSPAFANIQWGTYVSEYCNVHTLSEPLLIA
ncbi:general substrate transporter [Phellopilus nigrolimitatus]|nr:general substrate transporter [Phellopilus nigrolimitatus]